MNEVKEYTTDLIEVSVSGIFKTKHVFLSMTDTLGVLTLNSSRSEGEFEGENGSYFKLKKPSIWKSYYEWKEQGINIATAIPKGRMSRIFLINHQDRDYGIFPGGSRLRSWKLKNNLGKEICEFQPRAAFKRGAIIKIKVELPVDLLVFTYFLVNKRWQENSSA